MRWIALLLVLAPATMADEAEIAAVTAELSRGYDDAILRRAAASDRAATRRAAARAAGRLKDRCALDWLLPMLNDSAGPVRRSALFAMGQIGGNEMAFAIRGRLAGMDPADLPVALEALGRSADPRAVSDVVRFLRHIDAPVRGEAALALFRLKDTSAIPDLFAALARERNDEARWRIVYGIWYLAREKQRRARIPVKADDAWKRLLAAAAAKERPFQERVFAIRALGQVEGGDAIALLGDKDPRINIAVIRATANPFDPATANKVTPFLKNKDPLLREVALEHLMVGKEKAKDYLNQAAIDLADDPRLQIRAAEAAVAAGAEIEAPTEQGDLNRADFEEAVWRINSYPPRKLPAELPTTTRGRVAAAEVCGEERVPTDFASKTLIGLLQFKDFTVRSTAIVSLAKLHAQKPEANAALKDLAALVRKQFAAAIVKAAKVSRDTVDMDVRIEAAKALGKLGIYDPWLREAAVEDEDRAVRDAARAAIMALGRDLPPAAPPAGFRLHGHDAAGILAATRALTGARVTLQTDRGKIVMVLFPDEAPAHCVNFATLVAQGFYDGLTWHRVVGNFVIQGGCPRGDGWGGPGYSLPDEIGRRQRYVRGTVGMPKAGDDTGGCQIFITHLPTPHLDGRYTVYAQVVEGLAVVDRIRIGDKILKATIKIPGQ